MVEAYTYYYTWVSVPVESIECCLTRNNSLIKLWLLPIHDHGLCDIWKNVPVTCFVFRLCCLILPCELC